MKTLFTILLAIGIHFKTYSQKTALNFWKLDEKENQIDNPETSSSEDKALGIRLFDLEGCQNYNTVKCVIEIEGYKVDEYTYDVVYQAEMPSFYDDADKSVNFKPGTKYKDLVVVGTGEDENSERFGNFSISYTHNLCGAKYIYSKEGCNNVKEYLIKATLIGQNVTYTKKYDPNNGMYIDFPNYTEPVKLSNTASVKIKTNKNIAKPTIELTIGKKSDLFDAINQANEKTEELNGNSKKKK